MGIETLEHVGPSDGPLPFDIYKCTVIRAAPRRFDVEVLRPRKQGYGSSYTHGLRIIPLCAGESDDTREYDVYRKWEDCLWFQNSLELEYKRGAQIKRHRLAQGKGVKKKGIYMQDMASSWASLPPGPAPGSIAKDVHTYLPCLTKKSSLFRVAQSTLQQRHTELTALINALFNPDLPTLIVELRQSRIISDFFGFWRQDKDIHECTSNRKRRSASVVECLTLSAFFPGLKDSTHDDSLTRHKEDSRPSISTDVASFSPRSSIASDGFRSPSPVTPSNEVESLSGTVQTGIDTTVASDFGQGQRPRALSTSSDSSGTLYDDCAETPSKGTVGECGHTSQGILDAHPEQKYLRTLEVWAASGDDLSPLKARSVEPWNKKCVVALSPPLRRKRNREYQIISPLRLDPVAHLNEYTIWEDEEGFVESPHRPWRSSWQSVGSAVTNSTLSESQDFHEPMASPAAVMTISAPTRSNSAIPEPEEKSQSGLPRTSCRTSFPVTLSDFDMYSDICAPEEPIDEFPRPVSLFSEIHDRLAHSSMNLGGNGLKLGDEDYFQTSPCDTSTLPPGLNSPQTAAAHNALGAPFLIKAMLDGDNVVIRVSRDTTFANVRQLLHNKFVGQEGVALSRSFKIAFKPPKIASDSDSLAELKLLTTEDDWVQIAQSVKGNKITIRVLDTPS